jgi:hypothetical protein
VCDKRSKLAYEKPGLRERLAEESAIPQTIIRRSIPEGHFKEYPDSQVIDDRLGRGSTVNQGSVLETTFGREKRSKHKRPDYGPDPSHDVAIAEKFAHVQVMQRVPNFGLYAKRPDILADKDARHAAEAIVAEKRKKQENMQAFWVAQRAKHQDSQKLFTTAKVAKSDALSFDVGRHDNVVRAGTENVRPMIKRIKNNVTEYVSDAQPNIRR